MAEFRTRSIVHAALGVAAALPMLVWLRGFLVDDAFVTARYAAHLATGAGHVLNVGDSSTDGVTPLGFSLLLSLFARGEEPVLAAFRAAKVLGMAAWLGGAASFGVAIGALEGGRLRYLALALVAASAPLGAWAAAGMETGIVIGLASVAVAWRALGFEGGAVAGAAACAWLRPELIPWASALALAPTARDALVLDSSQLMSRLRRGSVVLLAAGAAAWVRWVTFGHPLPLSFRAKAPDPLLGARYALACLLLGGVGAALGWRHLRPWAKGMLVAVLVHWVATALAGGDWMPLSRLVAPVLPGAFLVAGASLAAPRPWAALVRLGLALAGEGFAAVRAGPAAARVGERRLGVIRDLGPAIAGRTVATVDAGWVGVRAARVVDLAGITDPAVAALPGGHTSKRIPRGFLEARGVDALVLLLAPGASVEPALEDTYFARVTELRLARMPGVAASYCPSAESHEPRYVVLLPCSR